MRAEDVCSPDAGNFLSRSPFLDLQSITINEIKSIIARPSGCYEIQSNMQLQATTPLYYEKKQ